MPIVLTTLMRRARADQWLLSGIKKALPFNRVYQQIVGAGFGYRRTEMLRRWHDLAGFDKTREDIEKLYVDKPIPIVRHLYPEGDIGAAYRYRTMVTLRDPITGEEFEDKLTFLSNKPVDWETLRQKSIDLVMDSERNWEREIVKVELTEASKRR